MHKLSAIILPVCATCALLLACGGQQLPREAKSEPAAEAAPARPSLTAEACEASGGVVVGDIGDGATQRAEYRCSNGSRPSGNIRAAEAGRIASEGSVCCLR